MAITQNDDTVVYNFCDNLIRILIRLDIHILTFSKLNSFFRVKIPLKFFMSLFFAQELAYFEIANCYSHADSIYLSSENCGIAKPFSSFRLSRQRFLRERNK